MNPLTEKLLSRVVKFGPLSHESGLKKYGFKNVQIRVDMAFRPCLQGGRVTLVLGGLP